MPFSIVNEKKYDFKYEFRDNSFLVIYFIPAV